MLHVFMQDVRPPNKVPRPGHWVVLPKRPYAPGNHPNAEEVAECTALTRKDIIAIIVKRSASNQHKSMAEAAQPDNPQYIMYTPKTVSKHNSRVDQGIVQMQGMPRDPLEPLKFRHHKHYSTQRRRLMVEEPTSLMHSPTKAGKLTHDEQEKCSIPPCVSMWKNNKEMSAPPAVGLVL